MKMEFKAVLLPRTKTHIPAQHNLTDDEIDTALAAYRRMYKAIKADKLSETDKTMLRKAYELALQAHAPQRRKSGEPYIMHPIEVARICVAEFGLGPTSAIAALLHDVAEDTQVDLEDIAAEFNPKIKEIVEGLTKLGSINSLAEKNGMESPQAENFKKVLLTISKDVRVVLIKMADRLHNMRTLDSMPRHKQIKIAYETTFIYAPLAHRLGFYTLKGELEDLCMHITDPEQYNFVENKLKETAGLRNEYINAFKEPIEKKLKEDGYKAHVFGRVKSISSITSKLKKKAIPLEEIYDLFAIRIVLDISKEKEKSACWNAYSIVTDHYTPVPERLKDWISTAKSNGYESLHTTVMGPKGRFVEVQIRSERMNELSEMGVAAHWKYKGINAQETAFEEWLNKAKEILENPNNSAIDFLNDFKANLFAEEVYVFTPKGEMRFLPKGSTGLDFAFEVHTELGFRCKAVKVDQKIVPLSYELKSGEQIQIITASNQKPTEDWLKIVKTSKARNKIKLALREEKMQQSSFGKEAIERKFKSLKITFEENIDALVKFYNCQTRHDLYYQVYLGDIELDEIKLLKYENGKLYPEKIENTAKPSLIIEPIVSKKIIPNVKNSKPRILIEGEDKETGAISYSFSECCNPVFGEDIFAFVSTQSGMKIHRTTCSNAEYLQATYAHRVKKAEWQTSETDNFTADLLISGMDDMGVVQRLSEIVTNKLKLNMKAFSMSGDQGHFEGRISVVIRSKDELNLLIGELKKMQEVNSVVRLDNTGN
jgi:GTP diphosphokinase / guanosine-3',5'-bis(diphosphate) 3'-diphosphatase